MVSAPKKLHLRFYFTVDAAKDFVCDAKGYDEVGNTVLYNVKPGIVTPKNPQGLPVPDELYTIKNFLYYEILKKEQIDGGK